MNLSASLFAQLTVFGILAWFTVKFIWPPLRNALDERAAKVAAAMEAAERGKVDMITAAGRAQEEVVAAREVGRKLLADYDKRTQTIIEDAKRVAAGEAARIVASARMEADQLLDRARGQLREQAAAVAVAGAERILKREIDAAAHARLLARLKDELKE